MKTKITKAKASTLPKVGEVFEYGGQAYIRVDDEQGAKAFDVTAKGCLFATDLGTGFIYWWDLEALSQDFAILEPEGGVLRFVKKGTAP